MYVLSTTDFNLVYTNCFQLTRQGKQTFAYLLMGEKSRNVQFIIPQWQSLPTRVRSIYANWLAWIQMIKQVLIKN